MLHFNLTSSEYSLKNLGYNDIIIKKISSSQQNSIGLHSYMFTISKYPDKREYKKPIYLGEYISKYKNPNIIDNPEIVIRNCKYKSLMLGVPENLNIELTIHYEKAKFLIDEVIINAVKQINGTTFSLNPESYLLLKRTFPSVITANSLFIEYSVEISFTLMHGPVFSHMISALTGLDKKQLGTVREIKAIEQQTKKVIFSLYNEKGE